MHAYGLACIRARTHVRMLSCTYVRIFLRRRQAGCHGRSHAHTDACACIHAFIPNCLRVMHVFAYFHCLKQAAIKISSLANNLNENQREIERERERERERREFSQGDVGKYYVTRGNVTMTSSTLTNHFSVTQQKGVFCI